MQCAQSLCFHGTAVAVGTNTVGIYASGRSTSSENGSSHLGPTSPNATKLHLSYWLRPSAIVPTVAVGRMAVGGNCRLVIRDARGGHEPSGRFFVLGKEHPTYCHPRPVRQRLHWRICGRRAWRATDAPCHPRDAQSCPALRRRGALQVEQKLRRTRASTDRLPRVMRTSSRLCLLYTSPSPRD